MKFVTPSALWLLLLLPLLYFGIVLDEKRRQARFEAFAKSPLWPVLAPGMNPGARLRKAGFWLAALVFATLAMARPQWGTHEETATVTGLDIMVAVDLSNSMETEDVPPNRLRKAKHLVRSLGDRLRGDRMGLIGFAGSAYVASPLTNDLEYISDTLEILGTKSIANQGTDIAAALETAKKALDRGSEEPKAAAGDQGAKAFPSRVVLLITDGEDHEGGAAEMAAQLAKADIKLYILGVGTQKGGPIPIRDENGNLQGYKKDRKGQPIVSAFQPDTLIQLAAAGSGKYWNASTDETELDEMLRDLNALNRSEYAERRYVVYEDRYQFPLAIAVLLVLIEIGIPVARPRGGAALLAAFLLCGSLTALSPREARAETASSSKAVPLDAWMENRQGLKSFKDGSLDEAKKHFGAAQAIDPTRPELQYNQGVIQMGEGDTENAVQSFAQAAKDSQGNPALNGSALYNLGTALTKKGDIQNAVRSYLGAIQNAQQAGDVRLEEDARKNLELLIQQQQKQKQQDQQKKDQQKNESKDDKDQQQKQQKEQQKNDQKKDEKKDEQKKEDQQQKDQKKYEDPKESRKRQFRSLKLSHEDAERVMAELKNREKDLQNRLKRQQGNNRGAQKDW